MPKTALPGMPINKGVPAFLLGNPFFLDVIRLVSLSESEGFPIVYGGFKTTCFFAWVNISSKLL